MLDLEDTHEPVCPYCGNHNRNAWELGLPSDGDDTETTCGKCEKEYRVTLNLSITYSTEKI